MNIVSYGAGVNSTAMLVGMYEKGIPVDLILFADPGSEQPYTYDYLPIMDDWLARHGMPCIQTVYCTDKNGDAGRQELEQAIIQRFWMEPETEEKVRPPQEGRTGQKGDRQQRQTGQPLATIPNFMKKQDGPPPGEGE